MSMKLFSLGSQIAPETERFPRNTSCARFSKYCANTKIGRSFALIHQYIFGIDNSNHQVQSNVVSPSNILSPNTSSEWHSLTKDLMVFNSRFLTRNELSCSIRVCKSWCSALNKNDLIWKWQDKNIINPATLKKHVNLILSDVLDHTSRSLRFRGKHDVVNLTSEYCGDIRFFFENTKQLFAEMDPKIAFGKDEWMKYLGCDLGRIPSLPGDIYKILRGPCPFWQGRTVKETHTLTLIPQETTQKINNKWITKRFTLRTLEELMKSSKLPSFTSVGKDVLTKYGESSVGRSYWVLITNAVIPTSRRKSYDEQEKSVVDVNYEVPNLLDTATAVFMENIRSGNFLFPYRASELEYPVTYTRCKGTDEKAINLGCFDKGGLEMIFSDINKHHEYEGMAALRKL